MNYNLPKFCRVRYGRKKQVVLYFNRGVGDPFIRLPTLDNEIEFNRYYFAALAGKPLPIQSKPSAGRTVVLSKIFDNTLRWLWVEYEKSPQFKKLEPSTWQRKKAIMSVIMQERINPDHNMTFADCPLEAFTIRHFNVIRDRATSYGQANNRLKAIKSLFSWAHETGVIMTNPAIGVRNISPTNKDGYHTWTREEVQQYLEKHASGTMAHLALLILLYTGARISDAVQLGHSHIHDKMEENEVIKCIIFTPKKTENKTGVTIEMPILPPLQVEIDRLPVRQTFILSALNKPFTTESFGNRVREWCKEAGIPHCSAHGLRKAGATIAAENGASESALMALFGWTSARVASVYTKKASRKKLAKSSAKFIDLKL
jgi:integrase